MMELYFYFWSGESQFSPKNMNIWPQVNLKNYCTSYSNNLNLEGKQEFQTLDQRELIDQSAMVYNLS